MFTKCHITFFTFICDLLHCSDQLCKINRRSEPEVMNTQSPRTPNRDSFGTPLWESRDKEPFGRGRGGATQRILYGGRCWLPPSPGRGESSESKVARG
jgi:hypothetical protein